MTVAAVANKTEAMLSLRGVSGGYGGMPVLNDVSLEAYPAEIVA